MPITFESEGSTLRASMESNVPASMREERQDAYVRNFMEEVMYRTAKILGPEAVNVKWGDSDAYQYDKLMLEVEIPDPRKSQSAEIEQLKEENRELKEELRRARQGLRKVGNTVHTYTK